MPNHRVAGMGLARTASRCSAGVEMCPMIVLLVLGLVMLPFGSAVQCPARCSCPRDSTSSRIRCFARGLTAIPDLLPAYGTIADFYSNLISSLKPGAFQRLPLLVEIVLDANHLSWLPETVFRGLKRLHTLWLNDNRLLSLPPSVFEDLTSIGTLYLGNNQLKSLPASVFKGLNSLIYLDLYSNRILSLPPSVFEDLRAIQHLDLETNQLSSLPDSLFKGLRSLNTLWLSQNLLRSLPPSIFEDLTNLRTLYLNGNPLRSLPPSIFEDLTNLRTLHITRTPLFEERQLSLCTVFDTTATIEKERKEEVRSWGQGICPGANPTCYASNNITYTGCYCGDGQYYDGTGCVTYCNQTDFSDMCSGYPVCNNTAGQCSCPEGTSLNGRECQAQVRLVNGDTPWSGVLEVLMAGSWTGLCVDYVGSGDAQVACRQLGYLYDGSDVNGTKPTNSPGNVSIWRSNLNCNGRETNILACPRSPPVGVHNCTSKAILNCSRPTKCPDPGVVQSSTRAVTDFGLGSNVTFMCNDGYTILGASIITCMDSGKWSSSTPECQRIECDGQPFPVNGYVVSHNGTGVDSIIQYQCFTGYSLKGTSSTQCLPNGSWSSLPVCEPVPCYGAPLPGNGVIVTSSLDGVPGVPVTGATTDISVNSSFGSPLEYLCYTGHRLIGDRMLHCLANGSWSATPECIPVPCYDVPPVPSNGVVTSSSIDDKFGRTLYYRCNNGYNLMGDNISHCLANGTWSPTPECIAVECDGLPVPENGGIAFSSFNDSAVVDVTEGGVNASFHATFGSIFHNKCNHGYNLIGDRTSRCLSNGSWSSIAICRSEESEVLHTRGTLAGAVSGAAVAAAVLAVAVMYAIRPVKSRDITHGVCVTNCYDNSAAPQLSLKTRNRVLKTQVTEIQSTTTCDAV